MPIVTIEVKHGDETIMLLESDVVILPEDVTKTTRFLADKLTKRLIDQREAQKIREAGNRKRAKKLAGWHRTAGGNGAKAP